MADGSMAAPHFPPHTLSSAGALSLGLVCLPHAAIHSQEKKLPKSVGKKKKKNTEAVSKYRSNSLIISK
jgi:hypothetical protein